MKTLTITLTLLFFSLHLHSQEPIYFKNGNGVLTGNLSQGKPMPDLSWAWSSNNACFPETQKRKFTGNHVLYYTDLPAYSEMEITVVPNDPNANFSIYAYQVGKVTENKLVPNLSSCTRCEADHKWDYKKRGKIQDHSRTVTDILALANPFQVVIGVVGADGLAEGDYELHIKLKSK